MEKIKVLQSVSSLGIGGNELFVMNLFREIDKTKYQVDFLIYDERMEFAEEVTAAGSKIYLCPPVEGNKIVALFKQAKYVSKLLKEQKYDVIHCNGCSFVNIMRAAIPAWMNGKIKVISHGHSVGKVEKSFADEVLRRTLGVWLSNIVDLGFACSDSVGESKYTKKFRASEKYQIIRNAIETEKFVYNEEARMELRAKYGLSEKTVIGNVGRLSKEKNQAFLIEILQEIKKTRDDAAVMILGGGDEEAALRQKAKELGVEDSVVFTGSVFDAYRYYSAMDVYVMTSFYEGLPFTVIEAQVNGLKCVLTDAITKMADVTEENVFLSIKEDASLWAKHILDRGQTRCSAEQVAHVRELYDIANETRRIENFYAESR